MRRATFLVVLVAFVFSCGGQWYVLQAVAWANMIREYSQMVPLAQAVEMTFSGKYPCALCHAIAEKEKSEHARLGVLEKQKEKLFSPAPSAAPLPSASTFEIVFVSDSLQFRSEPPPAPPPRLA